jgi:hypothetical protein
MGKRALDESLHTAMLAAWLDHKVPLSVAASRIGVAVASIYNFAAGRGLPPRPRGRKKGEYYDYRKEERKT